MRRRFRPQPQRPSEPLAHRALASETVPHGGGVEVFDTLEAQAINRARLEHLASLSLPIAGRVLDVGGGVGHLAQFFVERGCEVISTDARAENVTRMTELYPTLDARTLDVERDDVAALGRFDVVFCYGLLYHLEDPLRALRKLASVCESMLLIESMICDAPIPVLRLDDETLALNQALAGLAHRPSPSYVALALDRIGFEHVYRPVAAPRHPDYEFEEQDDFAFARNGHLLRRVFVASRVPLSLPTLVPLIGSP